MSEVKKVRVSRKVRKVTGEKARIRLTKQGFRITYRPGQPNPCPSCSKSNWWVSSTNAECAFCHTALDIEGASRSSTRIVAQRPSANDFVLREIPQRIEPMVPIRGFRRLLEKII